MYCLYFMRNRLVAPAILICAAVCGGCSELVSPDLTPFKALQIEVTPAILNPGDSARVLFRNTGDADLFANACGSHLERMSAADTWQEIATVGPNCGDLLPVVKAGEELLSLAGVIPESAAPGTYRYKIGFVGHQGAGGPELVRLVVTSENFSVQ
jgi:hypothetical protein